jgi:Family of unknown function (DUF5706)
MERETFILESFKNMQELIRFIDQKAGASLVVCGFSLTAFIEFSKILAFTCHPKFMGVIAFLTGLLFMGILIYELYVLLVEIVRPRLAKNYKPDEHSIFYFEHIAALSKVQYLEELVNPKIFNEIAGQSYEVANILTTKIKRLSSSLRGLFWMIAALIAFILSSSALRA